MHVIPPTPILGPDGEISTDWHPLFTEFEPSDRATNLRGCDSNFEIEKKWATQTAISEGAQGHRPATIAVVRVSLCGTHTICTTYHWGWHDA